MQQLTAEDLLAHGISKQIIDLAQRRRAHRAQYENKKVTLEQVLRSRNMVGGALLDEIAHKVLGRTATVKVDIPLSVRKRLGIKVLDGVEDGRLKVLVASSLRDSDKEYLIELVRKLGVTDCFGVTEVPGDRAEIAEEINKESVDATRLGNNISALNEMGQNSGVSTAGVIQEITHEAVELGASDIHLTQSRGDYENEIAYRIGGSLDTKHILTEAAALSIMGALKQMCRLDATNRLSPQDGSMSVAYQERNIDVRCTVSPLGSGNEGEAAVLRILDPRNLKPLFVLFKEHPTVLLRLQKLSYFIARPAAGLVFITGQVNSGKSTTMYSVVGDMNKEHFKIRSIEDPIEQKIPGVLQTQVNLAVGLSFSAMVTANLRADTNVSVVGETRDDATMGAVIRAVQTGQLLLTTLHADSVAGTFNRIGTLLPSEDRMGGMLTVCGNLKLLMNQRLERRLCVCAHRGVAGEHPNKDLADFAREQGFEKIIVGRKAGCSTCNHTGYTNQLVQVPEVLVIPENEDIRSKMFEIWSSGQRTTKIQTLEGVFHYSRKDAVRTLLEACLLDLDRAHELLGDQTA